MASTLELLTAAQAEAWNSAPFEQVADTTADINDLLLERLGVRRGELHAALTDFFQCHQQADGSVSVPREYLITFGVRRTE